MKLHLAPLLPLVLLGASSAGGGATVESFDDPEGRVVVVGYETGVHVVPVQDPSQREMVAPPSVAGIDVAPDERTLALAGERGVELVDLDTRARWSVHEDPARSVAWADDGRRLAVSDGEVLELLDVISGARRPLVRASDVSVDGYCGVQQASHLLVDGWSHAGDVVVVTALAGCDEYCCADVVRVDVATTEVHRLSMGAESPWASFASVSPAQELVVFEEFDAIVVTGVRGEGRRELHNESYGRHWSPDGESVASSNHVREAVFVSALDGGTVQIEERFPDQPWVEAWSPDGTALLVRTHADDGGGEHVWLLDVASGQRREIPLAPLGWSVAWVGPATGPALVRSGGDDRVGTAALVATRWFPSPQPHAVIARADEFADALAAGSVVAADGGPVLLTASDALSPATERALELLQVETVTIMGGTAAVHAEVEADLEARGYRTRRIGGDDRYQTAARAADVVADGDVVLLASGVAFPDALALGPLAAAADAPILLATADRLPRTTADRLEQRTPQRLLVAGGPAALSDDVVADAERACRCIAERLAGADRTATAVAIAHELGRQTDSGGDGVFLVAGDRFPDALAAAAAAGRTGSPLLLTADRATLGSATTAYLSERAGDVRRIDIAGDDTVLDRTAAQDAVTASTAEDPQTSPGVEGAGR